jgi:hypothetical protein
MSQAFIKEHIEHAKADKEKERLKNKLMREKKKVGQTESTMRNLEVRSGYSFFKGFKRGNGSQCALQRRRHGARGTGSGAREAGS